MEHFWDGALRVGEEPADYISKPTPLRIERIDERTLLIEAKRGWISTTSERMLRNPEKAPAEVGDVVNLSDVSFEVVHVIDQRPDAIRVHFAMPLEDARLLWLQWDRDTRMLGHPRDRGE